MRRLGSILLIVAGCAALVAGIVGRYADQNILDPERFAELAVGALDDEGARDEIADVVVNELERRGVDRAQAGPVVDRAIGLVADSDSFRNALAAALVTANRAVLEDDRDSVGVVVQDVGAPLREAVAARSPELANQIPDDLDIVVAESADAGAIVDAVQAADRASEISGLMILLAAFLLIAGVVIARDRRTAAFGAGFGVALCGGLVAALYIAGREIAQSRPQDPAAQDAASAIWSAVFGDLQTTGLVMAGVGAAVALIALLAGRVRGRATA